MSTGNSTTPSTTDNSTDNSQKPAGNSMNAATYYGAIVVVVFLLIALAIVVRIVYAKKYKQRNPAIDEPTADSREQEERLAMERRGEEAGLPTYRESILLPNNDTVLAATPMSDEPFLQRPSTAETMPIPMTNVEVTDLGDLQAEESVQPPKYEADPTYPTPNSTALQPTTPEMRMSTHSTTTLVLPAISVNEPAEDPPPSDSSQSHETASPTTPALPSSDSNAQTNT